MSTVTPERLRDLTEWLALRISATKPEVSVMAVLELVDEKKGTIASWIRPFPPAEQLADEITKTTNRHADVSDEAALFTLRAYLGADASPRYVYPIRYDAPGVETAVDDVPMPDSFGFDECDCDPDDPLAQFIEYIKWEKEFREESHRWDVEQERNAQAENLRFRNGILEALMPLIPVLIDATRAKTETFQARVPGKKADRPRRTPPKKAK
jgi:hypothetical protein